MGQAKKRGTYEQRKVLAVDKYKMEKIEREKAKQEFEASLTPEQKRNKHKAVLNIALLTALSAGYCRDIKVF